MKIKNHYVFGLIVLMWGTAAVARAQSVKSPFQVLDCQNTFNERNKPIKRFQLLTLEEVIRIGESGNCLLIHSSGEMIELKADTTVRLGDLRLSNEGGTSEFDSRPVIEKLFLKNGGYMPDCHGCRGDFVFPPHWKKVVIGNDDDVCFRLKDRGAPGYTIKVISLFGDELGFYPIDGTELFLDREEFKKIAGTEPKVGIELVYNGKTVASTELWTNWNKPGKSFYSCNNTAFQSAMIGYFLETLQQFSEAERYFTLATQQSDHPVFREMMEHYRNRSASWLNAKRRK